MEHRTLNLRQIAVIDNPEKLLEIYRDSKTKDGIKESQIDALVVIFNRLLEINNSAKEIQYLIENDRYFWEILESCVEQNVDIILLKKYEEAVISSFLNVASKEPSTYQCYKFCKTISTIVKQNKNFPNRQLAARYFTVVSEMLKASNAYYNYYLCLRVLSTLSSGVVSKNELEFVKRCVNIRKEVVRYELLCGIKIEDVENESSNSDLSDSEAIKDEKWLCLVNSVENGEYLEYNIENMSFLKKLNIVYDVVDGKIRVKEYARVDASTLVYDVIKRYTPADKNIDNSRNDKVESINNKVESINNKSANKKMITKPKNVIKFSNRYNNLCREHYHLFKNIKRRFIEDKYLHERNKNRKMIIDKINDEVMREKEELVRVSEDVECLLAEVEEKNKERERIEEEKRLEKEKIEKKERDEKREMSRWTQKSKPGDGPSGVYVTPYSMNKDAKSSMNTDVKRSVNEKWGKKK